LKITDKLLLNNEKSEKNKTPTAVLVQHAVNKIALVNKPTAVLGISVDALRTLFKFSIKWDYVFEYKMDQSKSFAAVAEGIYNEIVHRTKVFIYIIYCSFCKVKEIYFASTTYAKSAPPLANVLATYWPLR